MNEASLKTTDSNKLRSLFSLILCFDHPSDPGKLWQKYIEELTADILFAEKALLNDKTLKINEEMINLSLFYLNKHLERNQSNLSKFPGIPQLPKN